ncbi:MAG: ATP-binding protein [Candidatus Binatia bacterium]
MTARALPAESLRGAIDPATLPFRSTEELAPLDGMIGQDRALSATTFGIGMRGSGYNLFALGPVATGKATTMRRVLTATAAGEPTPSDWCYVHNFVDPYRPTALELPAGRGHELRDAMARLVEECRTRVPRAFESEEFERQKNDMLEELAHRQQQQVEGLEGRCREAGFALVRTPAGMGIVPAPQGKPLSPDDFQALALEVRETYEQRSEALHDDLEATLRRLRENEREARTRHQKLVRDVAESVTRHLVLDLREQFEGLAAVQRYLDQVQADLIEHAEEFQHFGDKPPLPFLPAPGAFLEGYRVNVLVDRSGDRGAPVVFEQSPGHGNLLGKVEHRPHFGTLVTDFTLIKPGALHRANGGYLLLEAKDVLSNAFAWTALKKALKGRCIRIEEPLEDFRMSTVSLAPEPIPFDAKVVLIGSPYLYYLLHALDEDFGELFKVKVDFDDSLPRTTDVQLEYARFIGTICREEGLRHFTAGAVAVVLEHCARLVAHQGRLTARLGELRDLIREASFWAGREQRGQVEATDVRRAVTEKIYRANLVEEHVHRMFQEGTVLLATEGTAVGQVNGIAVLGLGDHTFGRPARITARTFTGEPGVIDIEREAKLGGRIHSKGVLILQGFLAGRYARERPLALAATLAFEQQYDEVEGDSASSAELYALLSSLAGIPIAQHLAVTGSVNQQGEIQAVGGVNEKIEGFFDVCRTAGLTGRQGVLIPAANVRHLMLREDVVQAVREDRFHVWAVASVDEGLQLLTGLPAGERRLDGTYADGTVNAAVERALAAHAERLKDFGA